MQKVLGLLLFSVGILTIGYVLQSDKGLVTSRVSTEVSSETGVIPEGLGECETIVHHLKQVGLENGFSEISINVNEEKLKQSDQFRHVTSCFKKKQESPHRLLVEGYTSNFNGEGGEDLFLQLSVIDILSGNKTDELTIRFENFEQMAASVSVE